MVIELIKMSGSQKVTQLIKTPWQTHLSVANFSFSQFPHEDYSSIHVSCRNLCWTCLYQKAVQTNCFKEQITDAIGPLSHKTAFGISTLKITSIKARPRTE